MKKGFTLIELLAVIVILAIIALIATPIVLNIINDSKESSSLRSAEFYLDAVEFSVANATLNNKKVQSGTYKIMSDGNVCIGTLTNGVCSGDILEVEVKGEVPTGGEVTIESGELSISLLKYNNATIVKNVIGELLNITDAMKEGTLAYKIIEQNGGIDNIKTLSSKFYLNDKHDGVYLEEGVTYTFGTGYKIDEETGRITLTGNIVEATIEECINGTTTCGKYTIEDGPNEFINRLKEIDSFENLSGTTYHTGNDFVIMGGTFNTGFYKTIDNLGYSYIFRGGDIGNYVQFGSSYDESKKGVFIYLGVESNILNGPFNSMTECENYRSEEITLNSAPEDLTCIEYTGIQSMLWKVVRINGDGTIRLAYVGKSNYGSIIGESSEIGNIGSSQFNPVGDKKYVGYTYNENGLEKDSTIKAYLDNWYTENLEQYSKYIADGQFCNERTLGTLNNNNQNFSSVDNTRKSTFVCSNKNDIYSMSTDNGNGLLNKPIGLLTIDEIRLSACWGSSCQFMNSYLDSYCNESYCNTLTSYWTMTPTYYSTTDNTTYNYLGDAVSATNVSKGVRPVINLKADVKFTGSGTLSDPYVIETE